METSTSDQTGTDRRSPQLLLTPEQVATSLAICRTRVYELLRRGDLESVQIGSSRRIPTAALSDFVEKLRAGSQVPDTAREHNSSSESTVLD
jgi:excisionase family DNA binding protein